MELIAEYLLQSEFDVVGLQEVWVRTDYEGLVERLKSKYPYSYSFKRYRLIVGRSVNIY